MTSEGIQTIKSNLPRSTTLPRMTFKYDRRLTTSSIVGLAQIAHAIRAGELGEPPASEMTSQSQTPEEARSTTAVWQKLRSVMVVHGGMDMT